ncbi:MAG TPA: hypothetical protein VFQ35_19460 [Polyangiaceae bacterium]|nr:hypothetical protein [Polyangiaceae bacterium]
MNPLSKEFWSSVGAIVLAAPRVLVPLGALAALSSGMTGCVSRLSYEEAASAAEVEREGHRRAELDLAALKARVAELEGQLKERSAGLSEREEKLAEEKYERNVASKERDETASLVAQLRGELARANEHLEAYARNNARLEHELSVSRDGGASSPLVQELKSVLTSAHLEQSVRLSENATGVTASVPADIVFKRGEAELGPALGSLSAALARFAESHPELRVTLREGAPDPALPDSIGKQRRDSLRALLSHPKLGSRVTFEPASGSAAPASYELTLAFAGQR